MSHETLKNILLVGSGGREHATAQTFLKSDAIGSLIVAPGNDGMFYGNHDIDQRLQRLNFRIETEADIIKLACYAHEKHIDLVFVGPENPLSLGITDVFEKEGIAIVGPNRYAAMLEGSKAWAKDVMQDLAIPIPDYAHFDDPEKARQYTLSRDYPVVVKADGLAAGKGSIVTDNHTQAVAAINKIMVEKIFKSAGDRVVIEKRLYGNEFSFFAFTDGETVLPMAWARDYKPIFDDDVGLNTGGMGGYSPYRESESDLTHLVMQRIAQPLVQGCREKYGITYKGILYIGGTFVKENDNINPYVFEINIRMGDPEAQTIYPRLKTDLVKISMGIVEGNLNQIGPLEWQSNYHVCVCATSGRTKGNNGWYAGYPARYAIGKEISGLENISPDILVFHSGTTYDPIRKKFITSGGRVISLVGSGGSLSQASENVYQAIGKIKFDGIHYRQDIGR
jgi:phosphoribosylamine---glycine ligase